MGFVFPSQSIECVMITIIARRHCIKDHLTISSVVSAESRLHIYRGSGQPDTDSQDIAGFFKYTEPHLCGREEAWGCRRTIVGPRRAFDGGETFRWGIVCASQSALNRIHHGQRTQNLEAAVDLLSIESSAQM